MGLLVIEKTIKGFGLWLATMGLLVIEKTIKGFGFWLANRARYPTHQKVDPSIPQVVRVTLVFIIS